MTVTILSVGVVLVIVLIAGLILVTVTFSRSLQKALETLERTHERGVRQTGDVLDRLMARSFEDYKVYALGEPSEEGSISYPTLPDRPWEVPAFAGDEGEEHEPR